jgi:hypothetical protein
VSVRAQPRRPRPLREEAGVLVQVGTRCVRAGVGRSLRFASSPHFEVGHEPGLAIEGAERVGSGTEKPLVQHGARPYLTVKWFGSRTRFAPYDRPSVMRRSTGAALRASRGTGTDDQISGLPRGSCPRATAPQLGRLASRGAAHRRPARCAPSALPRTPDPHELQYRSCCGGRGNRCARGRDYP